MKLSELVGKYVQLRDKKAEYKKEYDAKVENIDRALEQIEMAFLKTFEQLGVDSVKTDLGTAYRSTRSSISVADRDTFMQHCKEHDDYALLEVRPSKTAVEQYMSANDGQLPPGLNYRAEHVVNFRRSA